MVRIAVHVIFGLGLYFWLLACGFWTQSVVPWSELPLSKQLAFSSLYSYPVLYVAGVLLSGWTPLPPQQRWRVVLAFLPLLSFIGFWLFLGEFCC
jgi:hypothetical protein